MPPGAPYGSIASGLGYIVEQGCLCVWVAILFGRALEWPRWMSMCKRQLSRSRFGKCILEEVRLRTPKTVIWD